MLSLEVKVNGRLLCTAGTADSAILAVVTVENWRDWPSDQHLPPRPSLEVRGLEDFTNLRWPGVDALAPGDEISLRIVESSMPDEPSRETRKDADDEEVQERLNYERLRRKYEGR